MRNRAPAFQPGQNDAPPKLNLSVAEATSVGNRIWRNECGGRIDGLTSWTLVRIFLPWALDILFGIQRSHDKFERKLSQACCLLQENGVKLAGLAEG